MSEVIENQKNMDICTHLSGDINCNMLQCTDTKKLNKKKTQVRMCECRLQREYNSHRKQRDGVNGLGEGIKMRMKGGSVRVK